MSDWDAVQYHRLSDPQHSWGIRVLDRLTPVNGEAILDIGCGTGRLTSEITARAPGCQVTGTDRSATMLEQARGHYGDRARFVQADAVALPLRDETFDAVFSTATFHWIPDHPRLFQEIYRVLQPGGRLVAQCGGGPNLQRLYQRAQAARESSTYGRYFSGWTDPWYFATPEQTKKRLEEAGFSKVRTWLEPAQTTFDDVQAFATFITTVCLRQHLQRLPEQLREPFVRELSLAAATDDPPLTLDYWRLNIDGRRA